MLKSSSILIDHSWIKLKTRKHARSFWLFLCRIHFYMISVVLIFYQRYYLVFNVTLQLIYCLLLLSKIEKIIDICATFKWKHDFVMIIVVMRFCCHVKCWKIKKKWTSGVSSHNATQIVVIFVFISVYFPIICHKCCGVHLFPIFSMHHHCFLLLLDRCKRLTNQNGRVTQCIWCLRCDRSIFHRLSPITPISELAKKQPIIDGLSQQNGT